MTRHRKNYFNMVEVTLALGVAVIGVVCIMALIPVGMNASRDATADNYLPDVAQELLTIIKLDCKRADATWGVPANGPGKVPTSKPTANNWGDVDSIDRSSAYLGNPKESGGFVISNGDGNFLIVQQTKVADGPTPDDDVFNIDFAAAARVWQENISDFRFFNAVTPTVNVSGVSKAIYIEVSWPATIPYGRREELGNIRTYRMEVFNPEATLL